MENGLQITENILDDIDLESYLYEDANVEDVMEDLENEFSGEDRFKREPFNGYIFNCMNLYEFMDYLGRRYPDIHIGEKTCYYIN